MKKQLLTLALSAAIIAPAFAAEDAKLEEQWIYNSTNLNGKWTAGVDWSSTDAIMATPCARQGHGRNGKIYTIDMRKQAIIEISAEGEKVAYRLPQPVDENGDKISDDYYGTAISMDDAGNFLLGHYFTKKAPSSTVWSVYNPAEGKARRFDLGVPDGWSGGPDAAKREGIGRIDLVGRAQGNLLEDGVFFIAPYGNRPSDDPGEDGCASYAYVTRIVLTFGGDGTADSEDLIIDGSTHTPGHWLGTTDSHNIAQPRFASYDEFIENSEHPEDGCYIYSACGQNYDVCGTWTKGKEDYISTTFRDKGVFYKKGVGSNVSSSFGAFDTFEIDGERYFVLTYTLDTSNKRGMDIAVVNSKGSIVAQWENPNYYGVTGSYTSITAEPTADGKANIYIYAANDMAQGEALGSACAAMLTFTPAQVESDLGQITNPYKISEPLHLANLADYLKEGDFYVELENDIDMDGVNYSVPMAESTTTVMHFNGKNHVIKNLTVAGGNASLFGMFTGDVKNLGLENVNVDTRWFCVGPFAGIAKDATITNCYATGIARGAAVGGLVGAVNEGSLAIEHSYSKVNVEDYGGGHAAGLVGRIGTKNDNVAHSPVVTIKNSYAAGIITGIKNAAGIINGDTEDGDELTVVCDNVIAWAKEINCWSTKPAEATDDTPAVEGEEGNADQIYTGIVDFDESKCFVYEGMKINGVEVSAGASHTNLINKVQAWSEYSDQLTDNYPMLTWQGEGNGAGAGFNDIIVDEDAANAPAVYYNLQGVQVANPSNGIFIVRQGNKVTKVIK